MVESKPSDPMDLERFRRERIEFMEVYSYTHQLGMTDAPYSAESERVFAQWILLGRPTCPSAAFIVTLANLSAVRRMDERRPWDG